MVPETAVTGCNRKCPCRMWVNCSSYVDQKEQRNRLKRKSYRFEEWYKDHFREDIRMPDIAASG